MRFAAQKRILRRFFRKKKAIAPIDAIAFLQTHSFSSEHSNLAVGYLMRGSRL
jgi:hypothetical protein